uniref:uncharacterized protein isoform X1 n=1 Tax=Myxine glutinosa TaxID=7769 RepID=UPI00358DE5F0
MPKRKVSKRGMNLRKLPPLQLSSLGFDHEPVKNCHPGASKTGCQRRITGEKGYTKKKMPKKKVSKSGMNFKKLPPLKLSRLGFDQKPVRNCLPRASKTRCQRIMTGGKGYTEKKVTITAPVQMPKKKVSKSGMNFKKLPPLKLSRLGFDHKPVRNCLPRASKTRCQRRITGEKRYTEKKVTITAPVQAQAVTDLVTDSHFQFEVHPTMCAEHTCCKDSWHQQESKQPVLPVCGTNGEEVEGCAILKLKIEDVYSLCLTEERADLEEVMKVKVKTKQDFDEHLDFPRPKRVKTCIA